MAERRMFAKSIIDSDLFLDMPSSTQNLYFHLAMRADDDGFVNSPQKIMRSVSCSKNDMDMLVFKQFVIPFESGICVIKHWKIHNYLRNDRYKPTLYIEEKNRLSLDGSSSYVEGGIPLGIPVGDAGKVRIGKDSKGKENIGADAPTIFIKPSIEEVEAYCIERGNTIDPEAFIAFYTSVGWKVKNKPMKDWKSAVITWEKREKRQEAPKRTEPKYGVYKQSQEELENMPRG